MADNNPSNDSKESITEQDSIIKSNMINKERTLAPFENINKILKTENNLTNFVSQSNLLKEINLSPLRSMNTILKTESIVKNFSQLDNFLIRNNLNKLNMFGKKNKSLTFENSILNNNYKKKLKIRDDKSEDEDNNK